MTSRTTPPKKSKSSAKGRGKSPASSAKTKKTAGRKSPAGGRPKTSSSRRGKTGSRRAATKPSAFPKPEGGPALKARARRITDTLGELYGEMGTALKFKSPFELLVATVLSAQSTDEQVNRVTPALFKRFRDPKALAEADTAEVEKLVHSTGFYKQKTRSIQSLARDLLDRFGGKVPVEMEELTTLRGVGRKTANCVRSQAFGLPGVIVDTHFKRLAQRMALVDTDDPEKIEAQICKLLPETHWTKISNAFIWHGRKTCTARKPDCAHCSVLEDCPTGRLLISED